ncbi:MAG: hypothetical protein BMS9Abin11_1196 [Gammaproteobacteria bacterium]|nr:MAG: hypothetical protein BMS9Abin11_1196 [Gammaproteobacteria bacterium]
METIYKIIRGPATLRARMGLVISLLILVTTIVVTIALAAQTAQTQITNQKRLVNGLVSLVEPTVKHMLTRGDTSELNNYMNRFITDPAIAGVRITTASGIELYEHVGQQESPSWITYLLTQTRFDRESIKKDIIHAGKVVGRIEVGLSHKPLNDSISTIVINGALVCTVLVIISLLLVYSLLARFTAPLKQLARIAREVSRGNWSPEIKLIDSGSREIQELNQAFRDGSAAMLHYIHSLEETRELLEFSENKLRTLINGMHEILFELDTEGTICFLNPVWKRLTGVSVENTLGRPFREFLTEQDIIKLFSEKFLSQLSVKNREICISTDNGDPIWVTLEASAQYDADGNFTGVIGTLGDITESVELNKLLSKYQDELYNMSVTDPLTGLYNRRHFDTRLEVILSEQLLRKQSVCLMLIDLDGFKFINDTYGHPFGDQVLKTTANTIKHFLGDDGYLARLAGDEFAVILKNKDIKTAARKAHDLHELLNRTEVALPVGHIQIQCSIGIAEAPSHGQNAQDLITAADVALYQSKQRGRNRVEVLSPSISRAVMSIFHQGFQLRSALEEGNIVPALQPICDIKTGKPVAYEVLARMRRGNAIVDASEFIAVAEELGLAREVDLHIIGQALRYTNKDQALFLNINLTSFNDRNYINEIVALLKPECENGRSITIEITERDNVSITETLLSDIHTLRQIGCKLALDDFGSGFSTYNFLIQFEPQYLKIEGAFVLRMLRNEADRKIVEHIHELGQSFGMTTIAESVEDENSRKMLQKIGIHCGQGILFGGAQLIPTNESNDQIKALSR